MKINYATEHLPEVSEDLSKLIHAHWKEVSVDKDKMPLAPDWEAYYDKEIAGQLVIVTARTKEGKLIGYFSAILGPNLHYSETITATCDAIFVTKEYRKSSVGVRLMKLGEATLKDKGVSKLFVASKIGELNISPLYERLGFEQCEVYYSKWIGD